ncbi:MAG: hypothetical protein ABJA76_09555, partial [Mucilaginibacter sp.]
MEHSYDLTTLLGQSILSPAFKSFKSNFIFADEPVTELNYQGYIYNARLNDSTEEVILEFCGY